MYCQIYMDEDTEPRTIGFTKADLLIEKTIWFAINKFIALPASTAGVAALYFYLEANKHIIKKIQAVQLIDLL